MDIEKKIHQILNSIIDEHNFVVEVIYKDKKPKSKLSVYLDGDKGVSIDICAEVSRQLSEELDTLDLINGEFDLEVSSPGADKPLIHQRQFTQHINRTLSVTSLDGQTQEGILKENNQENITLEVIKNKKSKVAETLTIPHAQIKEAKVLISFK
jgi:ribosome maturation factor RimP